MRSTGIFPSPCAPWWNKVVILRCVCCSVSLLDEPFGGLDLHATEELAHILRSWEVQGRTVLAVVHELALARQHFRNGVLLNKRLIAAGPIETVLSPENIDLAFRDGVCAHADPLRLARTANFPK
jgi:ABC-type Mn2+/Zn2+ transport system ATPase subunit